MTYTLTWDHGVTADKVISFVMTHNEGDFASLNIIVENPNTSLLAGELRAVLSGPDGELFDGRIVGVPQEMVGPLVTLMFVARPTNYKSLVRSAANALKVLPYWDPVWTPPERRTDPDAVLEGYPKLWYINRTTGAVSASDIMASGSPVAIDPETIFEGSLSVKPGEAPLTSVRVKGEVHWRQSAQGEIDLTHRLRSVYWDKFSLDGIYLRTMSGQGFTGDWPDVGAGFGGGWEVSHSVCIEHEELQQLVPVRLTTGGFTPPDAVPLVGGFWPRDHPTPNIVVFGGFASDEEEPWGDAEEVEPDHITFTSTMPSAGESFKRPNFYRTGPLDMGLPSRVGVPQSYIETELKVRYKADRERVETVEFTLNAGVQPVLADPGDTEGVIELTSGEVDQKIDPKVPGPGYTRPIGNVMRNSYFNTTRGNKSVAHLIARARAMLLARARAVQVSFSVPLSVGAALTLDSSCTVTHASLPGGYATGKVTALVLSMDGGQGGATANVTISCLVGLGGTVTPVLPTWDYVEDDYVDPIYVYQTRTGGSIYALTTNDLTIVPYDNTPITAGDINLLNLGPSTGTIEMEGDVEQQASILIFGQPWHDTNEMLAALDVLPTKLTITMPPVSGDPAETPYEIEVSDLAVPQGIIL